MVWPDRELVLAAVSNTTNAPYYAEEFAHALSHVFFSVIDGVDLADTLLSDTVTQNIVFREADGETSKKLALSRSSGWVETPPHITKELLKRKFPAVDSLRVILTSERSKSSITAILASDIGLHRMELSEGTGHFIELGNKFSWDVKRHEFKLEDAHASE